MVRNSEVAITRMGTVVRVLGLLVSWGRGGGSGVELGLAPLVNAMGSHINDVNRNLRVKINVKYRTFVSKLPYLEHSTHLKPIVYSKESAMPLKKIGVVIIYSNWSRQPLWGCEAKGVGNH